MLPKSQRRANSKITFTRRTSSRSFFCFTHSDTPAERSEERELNKLTFYCIPFYQQHRYHLVSKLKVLIPSLTWPRSEVNQDLQLKLKTHFLPAMPRKYFSVRWQTRCSSVRDKRSGTQA